MLGDTVLTLIAGIIIGMIISYYIFWVIVWRHDRVEKRKRGE